MTDASIARDKPTADRPTADPAPDQTFDDLDGLVAADPADAPDLADAIAVDLAARLERKSPGAPD